MQSTLLTPAALAERWQIAQITLSHWRWSRRGPNYLKIGRRILYRVCDIEKFEEEQIHKDVSNIGLNFPMST